MRPLVSVIVPVYQVEKYLKRCLDSLLAQTYDNIEIIVVEDGSQDGSRAIVADYEQLYPDKIKAIYQSNQGLSAARNHGFEASKGEYIAFVDSDDYVAADMIETMMAEMKDGVSIVETMAYFAYDDKPPQPKPYQTKRSITKKEIEASQGVLLGLALTAHSKLYRRVLVEKVPFPVGLIHEDVYFTQCLYPYIESVVKSERGGYYHYQREGSITSTYSKKIYDMLEVQKRVVEAYHFSGLFPEYREILERNAIRTLVLSTIGRKMGCMKPEYQEDRKEYYEKIRRFIRMAYPNYQANPYLSLSEKVMAKLLLSDVLVAQAAWAGLSRMVRK